MSANLADELYVITDGGLFTFNTVTGEKQTLTTIDGLSSIDPNTIYYDEGSFAHKSAIKSGKSMKGIGCEFEPCGCPCGVLTCLACEWWGWSCWKITKCEFIIHLK